MAFTIVAVGMAVVTLVYGVWSLVNVLAIRTYRSTTSFPLTDTLVLRTGDGRVTLIPDATDEIVVEATVRRGLVDTREVATVQGGELVVDGACTAVFTSFCSVTLTVHVPRHLNLRGGIDDGRLTADGLIGSVDLRVGDGTVELHHLGSDHVDVSAVDGRVDIGLTDAPQVISLRTEDGTASVCLPAGAPSSSVTTTRRGDGSIVVDVPDDPRSSRSIALSTVDGRVAARFCS